ncbi:MAG: hypothetical protein Q4P36_09615 [Bowdeniella nasicola]|nr:hypothetical protein [Bowdeniella nasicola]
MKTPHAEPDPNEDVEVDTFHGVGNTLDDRLRSEVPENDRPRTDIPYDRSPGGVGQIVAEPDDDGPEDLPGEEQSVLARAEGKPRRDAAPEEAAMHYSDTYDSVDLYDGDGDYSADDDDEDDVEKRDDSAADFAFDEEEEDELA